MLQVLPSPTAVEVPCQPSGITKGGPWPASLLRLGSLWCQWWWWWGGTRHRLGGQILLLMWWLRTRASWSASWVTDGSVAVSTPSHCRLSTILHGATHRSGFACRSIRVDSPPRGHLWWLYHSLVGRCWLSRVRLPNGRCHLGHAWRRWGWHWHPLGLSAWTGHPCDSLCSAPQLGGPPNSREGRLGRGLRKRQPPPGEV